MDYLKEYGIAEEQIIKLKDKYNDAIISFMEDNRDFVTNTIKYLYSENIKSIYLLMVNNIQIFLETQVALQRKIEEMKNQGLNAKEIQLKLLQER